MSHVTFTGDTLLPAAIDFAKRRAAGSGKGRLARNWGQYSTIGGAAKGKALGGIFGARRPGASVFREPVFGESAGTAERTRQAVAAGAGNGSAQASGNQKCGPRYRYTTYNAKHRAGASERTGYNSSRIPPAVLGICFAECLPCSLLRRKPLWGAALLRRAPSLPGKLRRHKCRQSRLRPARPWQ